MRILWFSNTPSLYEEKNHKYYGGGWIESVERLIREREDIELGISFFHDTDSDWVKRNGSMYFPLRRKSPKINPIRTIIRNWRGLNRSEARIDDYLKVIEEFKPDVIQIFGSEDSFALVQEVTEIPVVIHMQGILNPYYNAYFPVNQSRFNFLLSAQFFFKNLIGTSPAFRVKNLKNSANLEKRILQFANHVMGRTEWDKIITKLYNSEVNYFHINEVIRPQFYVAERAIPFSQRKIKLLTTISPTLYKGIDVVLKSARLLQELTNLKFEWQIIGIGPDELLLKHFEKALKIQHSQVSMKCLGRKAPDEIINIMQGSDIFIHPSYIDNSPNSVCEAQMLGLPVIACNVGGVSSLIEHLDSGLLVPANGIYEIVHYVQYLSQFPDRARKIGNAAHFIAMKRHNKGEIVNEIIKTYYKILEKNARVIH